MLSPPKSELLLHNGPIQKGLNYQQEGKSCQWAESWAAHLAFFLVGLEDAVERVRIYTDLWAMANGLARTWRDLERTRWEDS